MRTTFEYLTLCHDPTQVHHNDHIPKYKCSFVREVASCCSRNQQFVCSPCSQLSTCGIVWNVEWQQYTDDRRLEKKLRISKDDNRKINSRVNANKFRKEGTHRLNVFLPVRVDPLNTFGIQHFTVSRVVLDHFFIPQSQRQGKSLFCRT
jgi:hypothetical protein